MNTPFVTSIKTVIKSEDITPYLPDGITEAQVIERIGAMYEGNMHEDIKWAIHDIEECG